MRRASLLGGLLLAVAAAQPLTAQTCSVTGAAACSVSGLNITMTIGRAHVLTLSSATTALTTPTPADFDAGFTESTGPMLTVQSNGAYDLTISTLVTVWSATATTTEPVRADKPVSDLGWATAAGGTYTPLSTTAASILSGAAATAGASRTLFFRTAYAWNLDTPGSYSVQLVFTLSAP